MSTNTTLWFAIFVLFLGLTALNTLKSTERLEEEQQALAKEMCQIVHDKEQARLNIKAMKEGGAHRYQPSTCK